MQQPKRSTISSVKELTPSASFSGAFADEDLEILKEEAREQIEVSSKRKLLKTALVVAGVGCAAVAGFAAGYLTAPQQQAVVEDTAAAYSPQYVLPNEEVSTEDKLNAIVDQNYGLKHNSAITNPEKLAEALHAYREDGTLLYNIPQEFLFELDQLAPEEENNRRLRGNDAESLEESQRFDKYDELINGNGNLERELQTSATTSALIRDIWNIQAVSGIQNMKFIERQGSDLLGVELSSDGRYCFVIAQESNDGGDWQNNLNVGTVAIKNVSPIEGTTDRFGSSITAYKGFGEAYNSMRLGMWAGIQQECANGASNMKYVFSGYSRGGSITAIAAAALSQEGKLDPRDISVINFGCPRTLKNVDADKVQGIFFEQWRITFKGDPVPSLPYGWMGGLRHYGFHKCRQCSHNPGRDSPGFAWPNGDHSGYFGWIPTLQSFDVRETHQRI